MLTHFSLFTGIGGIDLAAEWAGFETVGQCEFADYPTKVLEKHWPDVPRWRDVRDVTKTDFIRRTGTDEITLISGGFPCQDLSGAGRQAGLIDEDGNITRSGLWYEMLRIIRELRPKWVVGENVAGLLSIDNGRTLDEIVKGLEDSEYEVITIVSSASNYCASFEGKRVFIVAKAKSCRHGGCSCAELRTLQRKLVEGEHQRYSLWGKDERRIVQAVRTKTTPPDVLRGNYGFSDWVDRLKCLGNAVVPQQVFPILQAIAEIERSSQ